MDASTVTQPIAANGDSGEAALRADALGAEPITPSTAKTTPAQIVLIVLGVIAFLYFARPVVLPVVLACVAGMTLKPLIRWLSYCHIGPAFAAAIVLSLLMAAIGIGFFQLGHPGLTWVNEAPQHMTELRQRVQKIFRVSRASARRRRR